MKDTGLTEKEWEQIRTVFRAVPAIEKAVLFGSRAMGLARGNSDVDIMLYGEELTMGDVAHARALLEETTLPYQFDLILCDSMNTKLRKHIEQYGKILIENLKCHTRDWMTISLESAGVMLIDCDHRTPKEQNFGFPYITIPQLKDGRIAHHEARKISKEDFVEWTKKLLPKEHDVVVVRRCNSGENAVIPSGLQCAIGQNLVVLRSNGKYVYPPFLRWLVRGQEWWEEVRKYTNVGAVFDSLRCKDIPRFVLPIPPKNYQKQITVMLDALDDRIQLLHETNTTLEAMAQALFKSWFVDFDPVHAKAEGRAPDGMDAETAALFPDEFEESELGMIPKGWKVESLGTAFNLTMGQSPPGDTYNDSGDGVPFFQGRTDFGIRYPVNRKYCTSPTRIAQPNDTLISVRAPVGDINMAWKKCCIGRGVAAARHTSGGTSFTYYFLKSIQRKIAAFDDSGTVFGSITKKQFENIIILTPPQQLTVAFEQFVTAFDESIKMNTAKSRLLISLRDTLLPRLLSGKLRLPEFAEAVDEATV